MPRTVNRCKRCHRVLKTPESIAAGFGSVCYKKMFGNSEHLSMSRNSKSRYHRAKTEISREVDGQISIFELESEVQI